MSNRILYTILLMCLFAIAQTQETSDTTKNSGGQKTEKAGKIVLDELPQFNGIRGELGFREHVFEHLVYPDTASKLALEGIVYVQFSIDKEGNLVNAKVVKGVHEILDNEALRVINLSPKWTPGMVDNQPISVQYVFPVRFISYDTYLKDGKSKRQKRKEERKKKKQDKNDQ